MASDLSVLQAQQIIPYTFQGDAALLRKALTAGDSNSNDREGNRGMAQLGDALIGFVLMTEGFERGISRDQQQAITSEFKSKEICSMLARICGLDRLVKISERQEYIGPQPTILKNTLAAIVAAVWLDSRDYSSVVWVMAALGLVNCVEPTIDPQDLPFMNSTSSCSTTTLDWSDEARELDITIPDLNLNHSLDTRLQGANWVTLSPHFDLSSNSAILDQPQNFDPTLEAYQSTGPGDSHMSRSWDQCTSFDHTTVVDLVTMNGGNGMEQLTDHATHRADSEKSFKDASSRTQNPIQLNFEIYLARERQKLQHQPDVFTQHYGHMEPYQRALSSIKTSKPKALARMALAVGDWSAMRVLKQSIESARSPPRGDWFHVARKMSLEQRIDIIHHLSLRMAHLRLVRWLHIHKLYEDLSRNVGVKDVDGFVVLTNTNLNSSSSAAVLPAQRGNPRNIEQSNMTRRMVNRAGGSIREDGDGLKTANSMKRLRRVGHRLQLLIKRWGLGVLSLLVAGFTDDLMLTVPDIVFHQFLDVVNEFEGHSIRMVSETAEPAVQLLMDDSKALSRLVIEVVEEDALQSIPRLSYGMAALFTTADR